MTAFSPTDSQARAISGIKDWYLDWRTLGPDYVPQVYRVFGYAGSGKSTLVKHAIGELGLDGATGVVPETLYGTYTGKAAYVLRKKDVPCRTIHSLIYSVAEATEEEIEEAKRKLTDLQSRARNETGADRLMTEAQIGALYLAIKQMKLPQWRLNAASDVVDCNLLVLDEVSMVGDEMAADVLSFGKPVLVLGDPGQLPPIRGAGAFTQCEPDVMLTEIHRQAQESAIIRLATLARQNEYIPYGKHDEFVWKMHRTAITPDQMLRSDQVICGRNATRLDLNNAMRRAAGFGGRLPEGPDEKIICLKNDNQIGLINGMFLHLDNVGEESDLLFYAAVETEDGVQIGGTHARSGKQKTRAIYAGHFDDHLEFDPDRHDRDWKMKKKLVEATFGYAITCHKAQGSQWENIIVYDDHLGRTSEDRARWLYTAITRAETGLVLLD